MRWDSGSLQKGIEVCRNLCIVPALAGKDVLLLSVKRGNIIPEHYQKLVWVLGQIHGLCLTQIEKIALFHDARSIARQP